MTDRRVVNASPLIALAKAGHLYVLWDQGIEVLVPQAVVEEVRAGPPADPARQALESGGVWSVIPEEPLPMRVVEWSLGRGESAVIAAALARPGSTAILDDADGRRCARALGVPVMGTLGLVLRARSKGRIPSAAAVLKALRGAGFRLDDHVIRRALSTVVGEEWDAE